MSAPTGLCGSSCRVIRKGLPAGRPDTPGSFAKPLEKQRFSFSARLPGDCKLMGVSSRLRSSRVTSCVAQSTATAELLASAPVGAEPRARDPVLRYDGRGRTAQPAARAAGAATAAAAAAAAATAAAAAATAATAATTPALHRGIFLR